MPAYAGGNLSRPCRWTISGTARQARIPVAGPRHWHQHCQVRMGSGGSQGWDHLAASDRCTPL